MNPAFGVRASIVNFKMLLLLEKVTDAGKTTVSVEADNPPTREQVAEMERTIKETCPNEQSRLIANLNREIRQPSSASFRLVLRN